MNQALSRLGNRFVDLPSWSKISGLMLLDGSILLLSMWLAFTIRLSDFWPYYLQSAVWVLPTIVVISVPIFYIVGFYRSVLRYLSGNFVLNVTWGVGVSTALAYFVWTLSLLPQIPRSVWIIHFLVASLLITASRLAARSLVHIPRGAFASGERVAIYGAGSAGAQLALALNHSREFWPVIFVDDDKRLHGRRVASLPVYPAERLHALIPKLRIAGILLAMPSAPRPRLRSIIEQLEQLPVRVLAMPGLAELASGERRVEAVREVPVEDVLGRDPVMADRELLKRNIEGKSVLVTGAGGSIGSELCRQVLKQRPARLVLIEMSELKLWEMERELRSSSDFHGGSTELVCVLGSVRDQNRITSVMRTFTVQTVYHAAAYKHVPIVEHNPTEGVANNVLGTWSCAEAAASAGVETFVLVSTDKAVRPTNVMGATKRLAELVAQAFSNRGLGTSFCMVRFGNVLGSSGSVIPLFREQIKRGGPVTVTHPDVTRYFMTIPEAAQLVIQAGAMAEGGDVFVLQMGEPVNIFDLARRMIRLSGFDVKDEETPDGDLEIQIIGLRPGEKLYEELLIGASDVPTKHPSIMRATESALGWAEVQGYVTDLSMCVNTEHHAEIRRLLQSAVREYAPSAEIVDHLWSKRVAEKRTA